MKTEQEAFWAGEFGDGYTERNRGQDWIAANTALFATVLARTQGIESVLEMGANLGLNLLAIRNLLPKVEISAIEINAKAAEELGENLPTATVYQESILEFSPKRRWDLVFTKGVLIHIDPSKLPQIYECLWEASARYLLVAEYYNPTPTEVPYRGHLGRLFKRDFAGEILDRYSDLQLVDYGFVYHRDANFRQGDLTWFLMEKS